MYKAKNDIAVLLLFFNRPEQTAKVFEQIKLARPSRLYLYQDGPRKDRPNDAENIRKCREIVEDIDWECEVHRMYQKNNYGCDPSEFISQKWMFSTEERGIVLEDDDVPSQSFFPYCIELLEKFKDDLRIGIICGMNNIGEFDNGYSYLFTEYGSIWGWATWKRNVDMWDSQYKWMKDKHLLNMFHGRIDWADNFFDICRRHLASGREHYESILGANNYLNNQLNIVPCKNMITNVGVSAESTHSVSAVYKLPRATRKLLFMKRHEIELPLSHPPYVMEDFVFRKQFRKLCYPNKFSSICRRIESIIYSMCPPIGKLSLGKEED